MRNVWIIARREYKRFFTSPIAYIVAFFFMIILGYFFYSDLYSAIQYSVYYQSPPPGAEIVTGQIVILLIFGIPAITMRSISEEMRMGTMELLLTSPVRDWELIVGKWLGAFLFMLSLLAFTLFLPLILNFLVKPGIDWGILLSGYIGLILMVACLLAIGVFISSLFSNQVVVFFISLFLFLILYIVLRPLGGSTSSGLGNQILTNVNFIQHYMNLYQGTVDLKDIVYYLSITSLALVFGTVSIEVRRWH